MKYENITRKENTMVVKKTEKPWYKNDKIVAGVLHLGKEEVVEVNLYKAKNH